MLIRSLFIGASVIVGSPASAHAADAPDGDILVSATPFRDDGSMEADAETLRSSRAISVADQLARTAPGVVISEVQGNPLQPDIAYRGFAASPLLGTPQGLSVYLDGVRMNQPFGDVVDWATMPTMAIAGIDLVSGAAPQFGRNALGGAIAVTTKDGRSAPGGGAEVSVASFNRATVKAEFGGQADSGLDWYLAADHFREDGWREFSPSRATRAFGKIGWSDARSHIALSGLFADTDLNGNGLQEMRMLSADRRSVYTAPDNTRSQAGLVNLTASHGFSTAIRVTANLFWRKQRSATLNGDVNDAALGENVYQPNASERDALAAAGYTDFPVAGETQSNTPFPKWRCIANVLLNDEPGETCNGIVNRSLTRQSEWGGGAELVITDPAIGVAQSLTVGLSYVNSRATFLQGSQFGYLLPNRTVVAVDGPGAFADGSQNPDSAFDARVDLHSRTASLGAYFLETARLTPFLRLDLAGRYDRTVIHNRDRITPGGGTGSLDSDPVYARFNPSISLKWQPAAGAELAVSWSQASRAPSAIELGCSDPASPCRLPNALAGDPPLRQVIARAIEARARLRRPHWSLSATAYRTDASDDILFTTDDPSGFGYFRNFGKTRRQGLEIEGSAAFGAWTLSASYAFTDATYRSAEIVGGSANSSSDAAAPGFEGSIAITPGDRIPLIPRHLFKAAIGWAPIRQVLLSLETVAASGVYARGNEDNLHMPDGVYYLGPGMTDAYAVFNLGIEVHPVSTVTLFADVHNLFDKEYATAAQLGPTAFAVSRTYVARPFSGPVIGGARPLLSSTFFAPGAPRSLQIGARVKF